MKSCGCNFCNDLRNIEPAKYIGGGDDELKAFIKEAKEKKQFILHYPVDEGTMFEIVTECPECGGRQNSRSPDRYYPAGYFRFV